jgi:hypothetical protein
MKLRLKGLIKTEGFQVLTEISMQATLKENSIEFLESIKNSQTVNPLLLQLKALHDMRMEISTMLPCNHFTRAFQNKISVCHKP